MNRIETNALSDPDNIQMTDAEIENTTVLRGHEEIEAYHEQRRAILKTHMVIACRFNEALSMEGIPDDYTLPDLNNNEAFALARKLHRVTTSILADPLKIRRKIYDDWIITQDINRRMRFERDHYGD